MAKRIITKIGDVFCAEFDNGTKGYFQYIANDLTQLNSSVIRAFKTHYPINQELSIDDIVKDEVAFYAHTILRPGIAENAWYKVGKSMDLGLNELQKITFGYTIETDMIGYEVIDIDPFKNWIIWHINNEFVNIGTLPKSLHNTIEYGSVMPYICIKKRMRCGYYDWTSREYSILKREPRPEYKSFVKYRSGDSEYLQCFKGDYFDKGIILHNDKILRITRDDAIINHMDIAHKKFSDTNWEHDNFITEEEFNQVWNRD